MELDSSCCDSDGDTCARSSVVPAMRGLMSSFVRDESRKLTAVAPAAKVETTLDSASRERLMFVISWKFDRVLLYRSLPARSAKRSLLGSLGSTAAPEPSPSAAAPSGIWTYYQLPEHLRPVIFLDSGPLGEFCEKIFIPVEKLKYSLKILIN